MGGNEGRSVWDIPHPNFRGVFGLKPSATAIQTRHIVRAVLTFCPCYMDNGQEMTELLAELGWSQAYFARKVGVSEKTVSRWCRGRADPVAMAYLELVKRIVG